MLYEVITPMLFHVKQSPPPPRRRTMHLNEFYARCVRHDWFYQYSGDKRELEIGDCEESLLASAAYSSQRLDRVYSAFCAWRHGRP